MHTGTQLDIGSLCFSSTTFIMMPLFIKTLDKFWVNERVSYCYLSSKKLGSVLCFPNYLSSSKLLHITLLHTPTHSPLHIYIHQNCFILSSYITSRSFVHYLFLVVFVFLCTSFPFCFYCPVSHSHRFAVFVCWGGWVRVHNHTHVQ